MINYLIVAFALTLVYFASAERIITYIRLIRLQGLLLCGIALFELSEINLGNLLFIISETLLFKTFMMPFLLSKIVDNSGVTKVHRLAMPAFYTLLISIISLLISVVLAASIMNNYVSIIYMTIALFALFTGLILIVTHRLIVSHLIGFMIIENAVFFFSLAMGSKMPMLINVGILLDIFVGVLILGFFGLRLKAHTNELTRLKD